ncbi:MAG: SHOCT domain-containing protein [Nannocystaceae bacterium]|nr:SHOCT domain-containing protein [Nannocystaceae bacterium]
MSLIVLASAAWMAVDAAQLGYDKRDVRGLAAMSPAGWFICGLLLWIVAFPLYLVKRGELREAGERRRLAPNAQAGMLPPGSVVGQPPYPQPPYPQQPYPQPPYYPPQPYPPQAYPPQQPYPSQQPYPAQAPPSQPAAAETPLGTDEVAEWIVRLGQMRDAGLLTDAEFEQQKARVLARLA